MDMKQLPLWIDFLVRRQSIFPNLSLRISIFARFRSPFVLPSFAKSINFVHFPIVTQIFKYVFFFRIRRINERKGWDKELNCKISKQQPSPLPSPPPSPQSTVIVKTNIFTWTKVLIWIYFFASPKTFPVFTFDLPPGENNLFYFPFCWFVCSSQPRIRHFLGDWTLIQKNLRSIAWCRKNNAQTKRFTFWFTHLNGDVKYIFLTLRHSNE